jgi:hypothetical protein
MFLQDVGTNPVEEKNDKKMKKEENRNGKKNIERENKSFKLQGAKHPWIRFSLQLFDYDIIFFLEKLFTCFLS